MIRTTSIIIICGVRTYSYNESEENDIYHQHLYCIH